MIEFTCQCGKHLKADDRHAGGKARCPACRQIIMVPTLEELDDEVPSECPSCRMLKKAREHAGKKIKCPVCREVVEVRGAVHRGVERGVMASP